MTCEIPRIPRYIGAASCVLASGASRRRLRKHQMLGIDHEADEGVLVFIASVGGQQSISNWRFSLRDRAMRFDIALVKFYPSSKTKSSVTHAIMLDSVVIDFSQFFLFMFLGAFLVNLALLFMTFFMVLEYYRSGPSIQIGWLNRHIIIFQQS